MVTLHTIVRNEERFIKPALLAALSSKKVVKAFVWDTGSTDDTVRKILSLDDKRIEFQEKGKVDRGELVELRNKQIQLTKTPWFLLVDGDEIWPEKNLGKLISTMEQCNNKTVALVNKTRNIVGDLFHYLPDSEGHYQIGPWRGHLNIRAIRNVEGLVVKGEYPNEWYELDGIKIQDHPECEKVGPFCTERSDLKKCLKFVDTWYLHATHLKRSNSWISEMMVKDRLKKHKWMFRYPKKTLLEMKGDELPNVLQDEEL